MQKPIALIFGATGGIGDAARSVFLESGYRVIPIGRSMLDFTLPTAEIKLIELLDGAQADVIVNSAGVFVNGASDSYQKTFDVNFGSNWNIVKYYHAIKNVSKPVKIIMIGSSSYTGGRSMYPLYSASKAALYNLWESSVDLFKDTDISVHLLNPMRTKTQMNAGHYNPKLPYYDPVDVAKEIFELAGQDGSNCVNMTLESVK